VLDVLWAIRRLVVAEVDVADVFGSTSRTRWLKQNGQTFELDIRLDDDRLRYRLVVRQEARKRASIAEEVASLNGHVVSRLTDEGLWAESGSGKPLQMTWRSRRSSLALVVGIADEGPGGRHRFLCSSLPSIGAPLSLFWLTRISSSSVGAGMSARRAGAREPTRSTMPRIARFNVSYSPNCPNDFADLDERHLHRQPRSEQVNTERHPAVGGTCQQQ